MSVSASSGVSVGAVGAVDLDEELRAVYQGGANFVARVQLLERRKVSATSALAELELATTAKAWRDEAEHLLASARTANDEAQRDLAAAKKRAQDLIAEAQEIHDRRQREAAEILRDAQVSASSAVNSANEQAASIRASAEASCKKALAEAMADRESAAKSLAEAQVRERGNATESARLAKLQDKIDRRAAQVKAAHDALSADE